MAAYETTAGGASLIEDRRPRQKAVTDERRHDFFITQNVVIDRYLPMIGPYGFTVYGYLVRLSSKEGDAYPSVKRIATACGMSESGVRSALNKLSEYELIRITERFSDYGDRESNVYAVLPVERESAQGVVRSTEGGGPFNGGGVVRQEDHHGTKTEIYQDPLTKMMLSADAQAAAAAAADPFTDPAPAPAPAPDLETQALRVYSGWANALFDLHGTEPFGKTREAYLKTLEGWLERGLVPTEAQVTKAARDAAKWWRDTHPKGSRCGTPGPLITALTPLVNPAPSEAPQADIEAIRAANQRAREAQLAYERRPRQ